MRDYKLTRKQVISSIIIVFVFGVLFYSPKVINKHSSSELIEWFTSPPGDIIYLAFLIVSIIIIDRYFIGIFGGPISKDQMIDMPFKRTLVILAIIPLTIVFIIGVHSLLRI